MTRISAAEYQSQKAPKRVNKYRNVPVHVDGIRFASKREAAYYGELKMREKLGEVYEVEMQRRFVLAVDGSLIAVYQADFSFWDAIAKRTRVIDVKGVETDVFKIKKKLMKALLNIDVEIVK